MYRLLTPVALAALLFASAAHQPAEAAFPLEDGLLESLGGDLGVEIDASMRNLSVFPDAMPTPFRDGVPRLASDFVARVKDAADGYIKYARLTGNLFLRVAAQDIIRTADGFDPIVKIYGTARTVGEAIGALDELGGQLAELIGQLVDVNDCCLPPLPPIARR